METFITFGLGVVITLSIVGVIYSVKTISKIKKETNETLDEIEEYTSSIDEIEERVTKIEKSIELLDRAISLITNANIRPNSVAAIENGEILSKILNRIKTPNAITTPGSA